MSNKTAAIHPGEILREEFMRPMAISGYALAKGLHFPGIYEVVREERAISADTAIRLGKYFGLPAQFWLNLQDAFAVQQVRRKYSKELNAIQPLARAMAR